MNDRFYYSWLILFNISRLERKKQLILHQSVVNEFNPWFTWYNIHMPKKKYIYINLVVIFHNYSTLHFEHINKLYLLWQYFSIIDLKLYIQFKGKNIWHKYNIKTIKKKWTHINIFTIDLCPIQFVLKNLKNIMRTKSKYFHNKH